MKYLSKKIFQIYDRVFPGIKHLRGATRIHRFLLERWLRHEITKLEDHHVTVYDGLEIHAESFEDLEDIYRENLVESYLKNFEIAEDSSVLVAGAYPGSFVIYLAKKIDDGNLVAVEPDRKNRKVLKENLDLNGIENVDVVKNPIYSSETEISFAERGDHSSKISKGDGTLKKTTTVDQLTEKKGRFDLVTMDIEGAEIEAIKGAEDTIRNSSTSFAIRSYHEVEGVPSSVKVEEMTKKWQRDPVTSDFYPIERTTYF